MRKFGLTIIFLFLTIVAFASNVPQPVDWVNDFANVIDEQYKQKLTSLIKELEQKTTTEIAVVTIDSIAPYDEKEYARMLFDAWQPGKKGKDNGVLVFLAVKERRWRIETGYGIEGILPDGLCGDIGRNYMVPYFKAGSYGQGLYEGVVKIAGIVLGQIKPSSIKRETHRLDDSTREGLFYVITLILIFMPWVLFVIFLIIITVWIIFSKKIVFLPIVFFALLFSSFIKLTRHLGRRSSVGGWWGGGGFGGGFGGGGGGFGGFGGGGGGGGGAGGGF